MKLAAWTAEDAYSLASTRFKRFCSAAVKFPITPPAMKVVTKQATGRPRLILSLTRTLLSLGATQRVLIIDDEFCKEYLWEEESLDAFKLELGKNDSALQGARKLRGAFDPEKDDPRRFKILALVSKLGKVRSDISMGDIRRDYGTDVESRTFWDIITILENTKLIKRLHAPQRKDVYELDPDIASLFRVVKNLEEPVEFLPYAISMLQREVRLQGQRFDGAIEITKLLSGSPSSFYTPDEATSALLENQANLDSARRLALQRGQTEDRVYSLVRKIVSQTLDRLRRKGLVQAKDKNGSTVYGWLPKHLDWRQFEGLDVDPFVIADLEAAEMSFRNGLYDAAGPLSRGVVERSLRRLYETSQGQKCRNDWAIEELNSELYKLKVYDRKIQSNVLGLQQLTNPIVHGEVVGIGERRARILLDMAQEIVKDVYAKVNEIVKSTPPITETNESEAVSKSAVADSLISTTESPTRTPNSPQQANSVGGENEARRT